MGAKPKSVAGSWSTETISHEAVSGVRDSKIQDNKTHNNISSVTVSVQRRSTEYELTYQSFHTVTGFLRFDRNRLTILNLMTTRTERKTGNP